MLGLKAIRVTVHSACIELNVASEWVGRRCGSTAAMICVYIFVLKLYLYIRNKIMADIPEYDPTKDDTGAAEGGATGGGD